MDEKTLEKMKENLSIVVDYLNNKFIPRLSKLKSALAELKAGEEHQTSRIDTIDEFVTELDNRVKELETAAKQQSARNAAPIQQESSDEIMI